MRRSTHPRLMRHAYPRGRVLREVDAEADIEMLDAEPIIEEYARRDEYPIDAYDGAPAGGMPPLALPPSQGNSSCQYPSLAVGPVVPVPKPKKKVVDTVTVDLGGAVKRIARMDIELR
ncbi:hypothetical protein C8034_v008826 [Colletotrichum sidae]|uniref:Uncharacterized protein n=3 Tax=Colletotrichum orbiculare species complex TaxID=2707354 RepID=A0A484G7V5_COLOR|nr:hypothetical protein C8035_v009129 [Colletotrichum spinosum]TDZ26382.1 hypothetical protein Cob_v001472 [Colletotrichum orbiculare MAFF 240422]TEA19748.1 hypothetical protein C8034_v008826 [Colletotrichum sidae]